MVLFAQAKHQHVLGQFETERQGYHILVFLGIVQHIAHLVYQGYQLECNLNQVIQLRIQ